MSYSQICLFYSDQVDVKLLKQNIWKDLGPEQTTEEAEEAEAEQDNSKMEHVKGVDSTFQTMISNVCPQVPGNVTVSFYFICALHLANEKGLELIGQDNLCDFSIKSGSEGGH